MPVSDATTTALLMFEVGGHRFALPAAAVEHIVRATAIAPLPAAPAIIDGVVNVHGDLLPVIDVTARFGLAPTPLSPEQHFILAHAAGRRVALRVDRAVELITVPAADIRPAADVAPGARHSTALARLADGAVVIQDLAQVLSLDDIAQLDAALAWP